MRKKNIEQPIIKFPLAILVGSAQESVCVQDNLAEIPREIRVERGKRGGGGAKKEHNNHS